MSSMCPLLLCACVFVAGSAHIDDKPFYDVQDEQLCLKLFDTFIDDHGKLYSEEEKLKRYDIFKHNLNDINERNSKNPLAVFDISHHSDLTEDEFIAQYTGLVIDDNIKYDDMLNISALNLPNVPDSFDWRDHNVVTPVKNQGQCGSCWAFSAIGNIEGQHALKHKKLISLSAQQLVSCDRSNHGCMGGTPVAAMDDLGYNNVGVESEEDYPYVSQHGDVPECKYEDKVAAKIVGYITLHLERKSEEKLKEFIGNHGPLAISLNANGLHGYKKGILTNCDFKTINHAVLIVGYGSENGAPYWLVKNSWGEEFGEKGYFRMSFGKNCLNFMHVATTAVVQ